MDHFCLAPERIVECTLFHRKQAAGIRPVFIHPASGFAEKRTDPLAAVRHPKENIRKVVARTQYDVDISVQESVRCDVYMSFELNHIIGI